MGFLPLRTAPHNSMAGREGLPGDGPTHKSPRLAASPLTPVVTPAQSRTARALLGWSQEELARNAGVSRYSVAQFELELRQGSQKLRDKMQIALEDAGVEFTCGKRPGVRLRWRRSSSRSGVRGRWAGTPTQGFPFSRSNNAAKIARTLLSEAGGLWGPTNVQSQG